VNSSTPPRDPTPLLVAGSGIAGLLVALRAAADGPVVVVTKADLQEGSTRHAQGGLAAAVGLGDSPGAHLTDTLAVGAGLSERAAAALMCAEAPAWVAELLALGMPFDREDGRLALAREGAHSAARVLHAGGDATGAHLAATLAAAARAHPQIAIAEGENALEVLVRDGRAWGLRTRDAAGRERVREGRAVVLATGGSGQLYSRTTNPPVATADGPALAARAGAALADLELVQFHPTALSVGASPLPLVSEAVRGEGAFLRDAAGRRFMRGLHPLAELGPRDVVARAIAAQARADGREVTLDLSHIDPELVRARFPTVAAACAAHGLDLARDRIPVTPAAHYAMGGVLTDLSGRTTLPGLWAVGECAATGAHGANRLASNSLLEAAVFAGRVAASVAAGEREWPDGPLAGPAPAPPMLEAAGAPDPRPALQTAMWEGAGVERDGDGLAALRRTLEGMARPADPETANLLEVARLTAAAAALRTESRGAHFRRDHPQADPAQARRIAWAGGEPHLLAGRTRRRVRRRTPVRAAA
jgi:L-aspartate oxidase